MKKFVIIGNSAAGIAAVEAIREHDRESKITVLSDENYTSYCRCLISYYLSGQITEDKLIYRAPEFYKNKNIELLLAKKVVRIDFKKKIVYLEDKTKVEFDSILIASGASPKMPEIKGIGKRDVSGFRTVEEAKDIITRLPVIKTACVLGGGLIGLKAAYGFHKRKIDVKVIVKSGQVLSQMLDKTAADMIQKRIQDNGIEIVTGQDVVEIIGNGDLRAVKLESGKAIGCETVIVGKGVSPNISFLKDSGISIDAGIVVNEKQLTNIDDCYAAGDVAQGYDITTEKKEVNALWPIAVEQGRIAGLNMAGVDTAYIGSIGMNSIEFFDVPVISIGIIKPKDTSLKEIILKDEAKSSYRKVVLKDDIIVGAILLGNVENAGIYLKLMKERINISGIRDDLLDRMSYAKIMDLIKDKEKIYV